MIKLTSSEKYIWSQYKKSLTSITDLGNEFLILSDEEIKEKTLQIKSLSSEANHLSQKTIIQSFALTREAASRTIGLKHYDVQLLGGLVLHEGKIAEMKTGEGKTLVATCPAIVNSLVGQGVHVITVNDYLAKRDAEWMGQIYHSLGLKVGLIQSSMGGIERKKNYLRDIIYVTNVDLVFDFLRDNMSTTLSQLVQNSFNYCIIDEIDSILIDEARTPLIISRQSELTIEKYFKANEAAKYLKEKEHFEIDEKAKRISLTNKGLYRTKILLKVDNIYDVEDPWIPYVLNALKAHYLFFRDIHYILKNNIILIIDEFTGRILEGRKWGDGLHQAIEAKENIGVLKGTETLASITYQNFFRLYEKIAGMTGTAKTEELEFENIYNLSVSVLPTYEKMQRRDYSDFLFLDEISKWKAVTAECLKIYKTGRPVLVGTTTIQNSEVLSHLLNSFNVPHQLLNAKPNYIEKESKIIAQAGCLNSITIATNMAGRGTDILLGGNPEFRASESTRYILKKLIQQEKFYIPGLHLEDLRAGLRRNPRLMAELQKKFENLLTVIQVYNERLNSFEKSIYSLYIILLRYYKTLQKKEADKVKSLGGLYVIGTERHESRRIDNQLRGRAGRQGNPGSSRFFLSLTDPLIRVFGGQKVQETLQQLEMGEEVIHSDFLSASLNSAQQKVEGFYYDQRKSLNRYDQVLDRQRKVVYNLRQKVLYTPILRDLIIEFGEGLIDDIIYHIDTRNEKTNKAYLSKKVVKILNRLSITTDMIYLNRNNLSLLKKFLYEQLWETYTCKEFEFSYYDARLIHRYTQLLFFKYIDFYWYKHLENIQFLREAISWEAYAQKDPFIRYDENATRLLNMALKDCRDSIVFEVFVSTIL